ncbi:hypothetical protein ASE11_13870 [Hydrogenophaga sp. Root209]|uniref:hypothetical protein n=1 Tax=Hydrogenophaga sp. Root209 TaxID=1736490 RepID=UPI0007014AE3|nr:hypothetical protein [Hydrogenophaga sp. Root209]KRB97904.1 hypothetical protein ASE11_13870 [Hydrogenophaga sp. Root209]
MKPLDWQYELHVLGTSKKTLSLDDFADLAKRLADLLGEQERVHFGALKDGSARILAKVEQSARQDVVLQLVKMRLGVAPAKITKLNDYLGSKGWRGELKNAEGGVIIAFPGTPQKKPEQVQTVYQTDSLIGQVIKIGGRDDSVPMTLKTPDGAFVDVNVKGRDEARKLAQHLFGADIKVNGNATWTRDEEGQWTCSAMEVLSFEETDSTSLVELFEALRRVPNNHWHKLEDPIAEWAKKHREDHS